MFIKILKASNNILWYHNDVGNNIEILDDTIHYSEANNDREYFMAPSGRGIYCDDCKIVNTYPTLSLKYKEVNKL